ncbi:hypothetical protein AKJ39_02825, partial [candidate division MSBL1 archaeon SCGC-AAA259J03]
PSRHCDSVPPHPPRAGKTGKRDREERDLGKYREAVRSVRDRAPSHCPPREIGASLFPFPLEAKRWIREEGRRRM